MSKDLERSLKDRIKAIAKAQNRAFNDLWKTLVLERFLVRLSREEAEFFSSTTPDAEFI